MAVHIWTGNVSTDIAVADNWMDQATGVPPGAPPGASDTIYIGEKIGTHNTLSGPIQMCENFIVFGTTASYFQPFPGPPFPGVTTPVIIDIAQIVCTGTMSFASGTEATTLQHEGAGFAAANFLTFSPGVMLFADLMYINGGDFTGTRANFNSKLWLGDGASGIDPILTLCDLAYYPSVAGSASMFITKDALDIGGFALNNATGGTCTLNMDLTLVAVFGARTTAFDTLLIQSWGALGPDPVNLSWAGPTPASYTDMHIVLDGASGSILPTIATNPTQEWRFILIGAWANQGLYATDNITQNKSGEFLLDGAAINPLLGITGFGQLRTSNNTLLVGTEIPWQTGGAVLDSTLQLQVPLTIMQDNGGPYRVCMFTCNEAASTFTANTVQCDNTLGLAHAGVLQIGTITDTAAVGPGSIVLGGDVDFFSSASNCRNNFTILPGATVTNTAGTLLTVHAGDVVASPGAVDSRGDWSAVTIDVKPTIGGQAAYISYHGQNGGGATGTAGTYNFHGSGTATPNVFAFNNQPGGSPTPLLSMKGIEFAGGNTSISFGHALGEVGISGGVIVPGGMQANTGTMDWSNCYKLVMEGTTSFHMGGDVLGWTAIPMIVWKTGTHSFEAPDQTLEEILNTEVYVTFGYAEDIALLNYTSGRFRQMSLTDHTTINAASPIKLQPTNGMTAWSDGVNVTLNAVQIDVDMRDVGVGNGSATLESYNTGTHGTVRAAFKNAYVTGPATLNIRDMHISTLQIYDVATAGVNDVTIDWLGTSSCVTQPIVVDQGSLGGATWHMKCTGDLTVLASVDYTTSGLHALWLSGGKLVCRNSGNTAYTDFELGTATMYLSGTLPAISMQCLSFRGAAGTIDMNSPTAHENTVIEVYKSHANPSTSPDAAVWLAATTISTESGWGTTKSINAAFETKAATSGEYALIHQACSAYTGIGVKGDSTKLVLDGTNHTLTGPFWHSSTETTFNGTILHGAGGGPCELYNVRGTIGVSSTLARLESRAGQVGAYTGSTDIALSHPHYIKVTTSGTGTLTHTTVQDTTYTVEDDGNGWGIETGANWTVSQDFHQGMDLKVVNGDIRYIGTGIVKADGDPTLYLLGAKTGAPTYLNIEVTSTWQIIGGAPVYTAVQIGDGTYNTTVANYLWNNLAVAPARSYPSHLNIATGCSCRPAIATTGAGYVTGGGTFDWNPNLFVGADQVFEITRSDNTVAFANSLTMANGHYLVPSLDTIMRFTPDADPTGGALVFPDVLTCNVEVGLQTAGTYTVQADYHVTQTGAIINGCLDVDWAETVHGVKGANLTKDSGPGAWGMLTIDGVNLDDYLTIHKNGRVLSACNITVKEADFLVEVGGVVQSNTLVIDHRTTTTYNTFTFQPTGAVSGTDLYFMGKDKDTTIVVNSTGAVAYTSIYFGISGLGGTSHNLKMQDVGSQFARQGTAFGVTNLELGTDSRINFLNGHSYWDFSVAGGTIIDRSTTPYTPAANMIADVYGTSSLGLIVVDGAQTLHQIMSASNTGIIADMLFLNNGATFETLDAGGAPAQGRRTLWLQGRACSDLYGAAATTNHDLGVGYDAPLTQPALHVHDSDFHFPSDNGNWGGSDTLVIGSNDAGDAAGNAAVYGGSNLTISSGNSGLLNTYYYNHGKGGFTYGCNNALAASTTALFQNARLIQNNVDDLNHLIRIQNYNGTGNTNTVLIEDNNITTANEGAGGLLHIAQVDQFAFKFNNNECIGNFKSALSGAVVLAGTPNLAEFSHNRIECTGTTAKIIAMNSIAWPADDTFFTFNNIVGMNLTAGQIAVDLPITTIFDTKRNFIACSAAATPIDSSGGAANTVEIQGWSLPITNTNIGKSRQNTIYPLRSHWTNCTNMSELIVAGVSGGHRATTVYAPALWKVNSGTAPTISKASGRKTFRKVQADGTVIYSLNIAPSSLATISWDDWDASDAITVEITRQTASGSSSIAVTNGAAFDASDCLYWYIKTTFPNTECGFANMKVVENVSGLVVFSDCQALKQVSQDSTADMILSGIGSGNFGFGGSNSAGGNAVQSHYYNDPVNQLIVGELNGAVANVASGTSRYVAAICAQDEDNRYEYRVHLVGGTWNQWIFKIVGGTETVLSGPTVITPNVAGLFYMQAGYIESTGEVWGSFSDSASESVNDATFTNGYFGLSGWGNNTSDTQFFNEICVFEGSPAGTQLILRYNNITFMPNSRYEFGGTITDVSLKHLVVNANQTTAFPNLHDGQWRTSVEDVSWADGRMDEDIESFVQLTGVTLEVDQDITLSGAGKLWLTGCNISGKDGIRWQIRTESVSNTVDPPLKIQGCLLSGLQYSLRPIGNFASETILLDDPSHSTSVIRMQTDKDIDVERHRVVGLQYDRMTDGGFESRLSTVTCVCVGDAYIMGMCEKMWMERTLIEFISPYCYTFRGKITQYNQRILNPQITASQFVIEIEEWRDD